MGVPKRKRSKARRDKRFANKGIEIKALGVCGNCTMPVVPHAVCKNCGYYRGIKITRTRIERGLKRDEVRKAKELRAKGRQASTETATQK